MRFRFCGDADCPDWVLAEINTLSRLSSIKLKQLGQVVAEGLINPPLNMDKAEKVFTDSKLDQNIELRACVACLTYIMSSTTRFNCDHGALSSELQQLGLPREHSISIKRVVDDHSVQLAIKLRETSLKINDLQDFAVSVDDDNDCAILDLTINNENQSVVLSPLTVDVLLDNLKLAKSKMTELANSPYNYM